MFLKQLHIHQFVEVTILDKSMKKFDNNIFIDKSSCSFTGIREKFSEKNIGKLISLWLKLANNNFGEFVQTKRHSVKHWYWYNANQQCTRFRYSDTRIQAHKKHWLSLWKENIISGLVHTVTALSIGLFPWFCNQIFHFGGNHSRSRRSVDQTWRGLSQGSFWLFPHIV